MENHHSDKRRPARKPRSAGGRSASNAQPGRAAAVLETLGRTAEDQLEAAGEFVGGYIEDGRSEVDRLGRQLQARIANRPWQTLFGAIGIGLLIGLILRRR